MQILRKAKPAQPIDYLWRNPHSAEGARTAVSLHSHTLHSRERLGFIPRVLAKLGPASAALQLMEERHRRTTGKEVPYDKVFWRPPLHPNAAYDVEAGQIRELLHLEPLVSITDHDNIEACAELRARGVEVPYSSEWSVAYEGTIFHIGIHNLPPDDARGLFEEMKRFTHNPSPEHLTILLRLFDSLPEVLVVLNHPLSNEAHTSICYHARVLQRFLREHGALIHALELNGLQPHRNNRRVAEMAAEIGLPVISGGDRHCLEPNANVNLTQASTMAEFIREVRYDKVSRVLFLPQYQEATSCRYVEFISEAVRTYPEFDGRERWIDRVYQETEDGGRPLSRYWPRGGPWPIRAFVAAVGVLASPHMRPTLRMALRAQAQVVA